MPDSKPLSDTTWLLRVPEVFESWRGEILAGLNAELIRKFGKDYALARMAGGFPSSSMAKFVSWKLPVQHAWPCNPRKIDGFIEKAAQALAKKFAADGVQAVMVGPLDAGGDRYFRSLASNLRGRTLQLFVGPMQGLRDAETQDPSRPTLFVMVGSEGLFAGVCSPAEAGGFYPGGTRFIKQSGPGAISRAGAKVAEALHHLRLFRGGLPSGAHWLELGASPGGMTSELLKRGFLVTAVDRAPLDLRLARAPGLRVIVGDAEDFDPPRGVTYDAILSDMNGDAVAAFCHVLRFVPRLAPAGLVVFTLKLAGVDDCSAVDVLEAQINEMAEGAGLKRLACQHLTYNRMEFTCLFQGR